MFCVMAWKSRRPAAVLLSVLSIGKETKLIAAVRRCGEKSILPLYLSFTRFRFFESVTY
jgi:hypothetical protein